jgi:Glycine/D-amino acid oxidases (deaminating)
MKTNFQTIIIGCGVTGAAIAYSLTQAGHRDILLLERNTPVNGATAKAATLVSLARSYASVIPFVRETIRQIHVLSTGEPEALGYYRVGSIHVAATGNSARGLDKTYKVSGSHGVIGETITLRKVGAEVPWLDAGSILNAYRYRDDGFVDGYLLTMAYLNAAREGGVEIVSGCEARTVMPMAAGGYSIATDKVQFHAQKVILAAGAWTNLLLEPLEQSIPFTPVRSQYWITGYNPRQFPARHPICILPDARAYTRPENGSLIVGWREPQCIWLDPHDLPDNAYSYTFRQDPDGWNNFEGCVESLAGHFPDLGDQEIAHYISGFSTYTPDGLFNLGPVPGFPGLYAAAGCAGMGIAVCGGIGRAMAELVLTGKSALPVEAFSLARFGKVNASTTAFMQRCADARAGKKTG